MLCLSRKEGERIILRVPPSAEVQEIVVQLIEHNGRRARFGITADRTVSIEREELQAWKRNASNATVKG